MKLCVLIPVFNEAATLREAADRIRRSPLPGSVITERLLVLADDGSSDGSRGIIEELAREPDVAAVYHGANRGKGAAVRSALAEALRLGADVVLIHDADLEYTPSDHAAMLAPILSGQADAVIGSRFLGQTHRVLYYWHAVANRVITTFSNMLTNLNLTDIECCLKAMTREVAQRIEVTEDRFGVEPELVAKLARLRLPAPGGVRPLRIYEVPVNYAGRTYAEGKKITWRDGFAALRCIVQHTLLR